ncbi:protein-methionine-sulfoxide reductase catalytic subunit MsrP [Oceanibacterium hippocampi]|uniref:Protein-methionine-sulfoxide reductase catalytic subunit MsrP n=1 Tax=Oceanibacterium hippocampi TaxID=745714 RepID=A0A1Y5TW28_9PROT|nr:protein-methionine-sulfoxide reductase catalytic subunit MsrP [Oceanibacterium hippocampi]SLN74324.1 Sulfoxide reductase catalytic subunit YedY precursor [Oceanibacterium hippocampi]
MLIRIRKGWELPEATATPEAIFRDRRSVLRGLAAGGLLAGAGPLLGAAAAAETPDPSAGLYPVQRNLRYKFSRPLTPFETASTYNNFYEFGSHKGIWKLAQKLPIRPWEIAIDGLVAEPKRIAIDDLLKQMPLEERVYRHRCVERWSMVVPWSGFPLAALVKLADPKPEAKYIVFETFQNKDVAPGQKEFWYPWPYIEGLTMAEATNELAFMVTGLYGKPLPKQNGAPLRLATPWKYGFKQIKSIVRISFTTERPKSYWETILGNEYGFWANVNPEVPHRRWSQATERDIGTNESLPTQIYNGYGEYVAGLYEGMSGERLFM